jgi:RHS repeat-associated protein
VQRIQYPLSPSFASAPEPFTVEYEYNVRGYLERVFQIEEDTRTTLFYQATAVDESGRVTGQWLGDGSLTTRGYEPASGRLAFTNASLHNGGSPVPIQNLVYAYDALGNVLSRADLLRGLSEDFGQDDFNRLSGATVDDGTSTTPVSYAYDVLGNLTEKSDHGAYSYSGLDAGPHAVTSVLTPSPDSQTLDYAYDGNGNQTSAELSNGDTRTLTLNSANLPIDISLSGTSISRSFRYDPDGQRFRQGHTDESSTTTVTHYVETLYTKETTGSPETHKHYVFADGQAIAILEDIGTETTPDTTVSYLHRDPLGSVTAIVHTDSGIDIEPLSYDPWGRRRDPDTWTGDPASPPSEARGYTGHEHLDDVSLIHMNGRVYDPVLGRILSPDPFVQNSVYSQDWNAYSYTSNRPTVFVDPSGFIYTFTYTVRRIDANGSWSSLTRSAWDMARAGVVGSSGIGRGGVGNAGTGGPGRNRGTVTPTIAGNAGGSVSGNSNQTTGNSNGPSEWVPNLLCTPVLGTRLICSGPAVLGAILAPGYTKIGAGVYLGYCMVEMELLCSVRESQ